jgi:nicotinamidase-related amidase
MTELLKQGYRVVIIADAVSSSSNEERLVALRRMQAVGVVVTSLESWLFETMETSEHAK